MKIGYANHPRKGVLEEIDWIGQNGFSFVDFFIEPDAAALEAIDVARVRERLERYSLGIVGHTAWYLPTGSPMGSMRAAAVEEIARTCPLLRSLGATHVTVHGNWASAKLFSLDETLGFQVQSLRELVGRAADSGMRIMYEPIGVERDNARNVRRILDEVPGLDLHIDIGHANLCNKNPAAFIQALHDRLVHIHLHDNNGVADLHLPLGCGVIDWRDVIQTLKSVYDRTITLEIFSPDRDYVRISKNKLEALWSELPCVNHEPSLFGPTPAQDSIGARNAK
jgi:sugar phosphate isomerase/epimerase